MDDTKTLNKPVQEIWPVKEILQEIPRLMDLYLKATLNVPMKNLVTNNCELLEGR